MKHYHLKSGLIILFVSLMHLRCSNATSAVMSALGGNSNLSGISSLIKGVGGLGNILGNKKGPFTLLAPTNDALSGLGQGGVENLLKPENKNMLTNLLKKHVIPGQHEAGQISGGGLKDELGNAVNLGDAKIQQTIKSKDAIIQVIDKVLQ